MNLLLLGRNMAIMQMGAQPIQDAGHQVTCVIEDEDAVAQLETGNFGAFMFGFAIDQATRVTFKNLIADKQWNIQVFEPQGLQDLPQILKLLNG